MKEVVKIAIRSESGYCCISSAYKDVLTIRPTGISYRYDPFMIMEENPPRKWSYRAESSAFREQFQLLVELAEKIVIGEEQVLVMDAGEIELTLYYANKTKKVQKFYIPDDGFMVMLQVIRQMIPSFEVMPALLENEDEDTEQE